MDTSNRQTSQTHKNFIATTRSWLRWLDTRFPEARPSSILFAGTMAAGLSNYVFNILFGRLMTPDDYGLLISLLALGAVFQKPISSVNMLMTQRTAISEEHERPAVIRQSLAQTLRWGVGVAIVMAVVIGIGKDWLLNLLNVPETGHLILVAFLIEFTMFSSVIRGLVRGLEKFSLLSINLIVQGFGRIAFGLGLLGLGVAGVMSATPLSHFLAIAICAGPLISIARRRTVDARPADPPLVSHLIYLVVTQSVIGLLINSDVIIARRILDPGEAGLYAALSILGKTILYLPSTVGSVVYPRISRQLKDGIQDRPIKLLLPGLTIILGIALPEIGLFSVIPEPIINLLYGGQYLPMAPLLGAYALAMLPLALNVVLSQYFLATGNKVYTVIGSLAAIAEWGLLTMTGSTLSLSRMILVIGVVNTVFAIMVLALTLRPVTVSSKIT